MRIFNKKKTQLTEKRDEVIAQINTAKSELSILQNQNISLKKTIDLNKLEEERGISRLSDLNVLKEQLEAKISTLQHDIEKESKKYNVIEEKNNNLLEEQENIKIASTGYMKEYEKEVKELKDKYSLLESEAKKSLEAVNEEVEKSKKELEEIEDKITIAKNSICSYEKVEELILENIESLKKSKEILAQDEKRLSNIKSSLFEEVKTIESKKEKGLLELSVLEKTIKNKEIELDNKDKEIKALQDKAIGYVERERKLEEASEKIVEYYKKAGVDIKI